MSRRLWSVILAVFAVGAGTSGLSWLSILSSDLSRLWIALGFVVAVALAEALPVRIRDRMDVTLGSVVIFTAILIDGPRLAAAALFGYLVGAWRWDGDSKLAKHLFNFGQLTISAYLAGTVFVALGRAPGGRAPGDASLIAAWETWVALLVVALAYTVINHVLVAIPIRIQTGERIRSTLKSILGSSILLQVLYAGLAILAAALILHDPWTIIFLVLPALVARHALLGYQREAEAYDRLVGALLKAIEVKDGYTAVHTERVSQLCVEVAREYGLDYNELRAVRYAAKLHDVGKLAVPQSIINKPAKLDHEEFELIKKHPTIGADILAEIEFLEPIIDGVRYHHERVDGDGYPFGLAGDEVPLLARIITVCDAFDAMTTTRSYRQAMEIDEAFDELYRCAGTQFDRDVVMVLEQVTQRLGWEPTHDAYTPQTSSLDEVGR